MFGTLAPHGLDAILTPVFFNAVYDRPPDRERNKRMSRPPGARESSAGIRLSAPYPLANSVVP